MSFILFALMFFIKNLISAPATKALPAPVIKIVSIDALLLANVNCLSYCCITSSFNAFKSSGLFMVIMAVEPFVSKSTNCIFQYCIPMDTGTCI